MKRTLFQLAFTVIASAILTSAMYAQGPTVQRQLPSGRAGLGSQPAPAPGGRNTYPLYETAGGGTSGSMPTNPGAPAGTGSGVINYGIFAPCANSASPNDKGFYAQMAYIFRECPMQMWNGLSPCNGLGGTPRSGPASAPLRSDPNRFLSFSQGTGLGGSESLNLPISGFVMAGNQLYVMGFDRKPAAVGQIEYGRFRDRPWFVPTGFSWQETPWAGLWNQAGEFSPGVALTMSGQGYWLPAGSSISTVVTLQDDILNPVSIMLTTDGPMAGWGIVQRGVGNVYRTAEFRLQ